MIDRPYRIIGLDEENSLFEGLVSYVRFGQAEGNVDVSHDWAAIPRDVSLNLNNIELDFVTGYRGNYAAAPSSNAFSFQIPWTTTTPNAYSHLSLVQGTTAPLDSTWRQWRPADTSDTTGFMWDHSGFDFRQAVYHQDGGGGYTAAKLPGVLPLNEWMWIVGRWTGSEIQIFRNGLLETSDGTPSTIEPFDGPCLSRSSDQLHGWRFATIAVWERALSEKEIWDLWDPATRWDFEVAEPSQALISVSGGGVTGPTIPALDEGHLTGGMQPLGGGLE